MFIKLIVGLGNPGPQYEKTRHNAGAWVIEALAAQHRVVLKPEIKFKGLVGVLHHSSNDCRLLCPTTFMNLSGHSVKALADFYKLEPTQILVIHDELDLPAGTAKIKRDGGHGGHNGLRDIIAQLHSSDFYRLRIGIGHPGQKELVADYVLQKPNKSDQQQIDDAITSALIVIPDIMDGHVERAMQKLHTEKNH